MAQIVLIDIETYRPGLNNIGDVVSVHEDDVLLGPSYDGFQVVAVPGTAQEVVDLINSKIPQTKHMFRTQGGDFGFPYEITGKDVQKARSHSKDLWMKDAWPGAKYPLQWLIDKFALVPEWEA